MIPWALAYLTPRTAYARPGSPLVMRCAVDVQGALIATAERLNASTLGRARAVFDEGRATSDAVAGCACRGGWELATAMAKRREARA